MATSFRQRGDVLDYANSSGSDIASGDVVVIVSGTNGWCGVASTDIADGTTGSVAVEGVFELAKATGGGSGFSAGTKLFWTGSALSEVSTSNDFIGYAFADAADGDTTARVKLAGMPLTVT